MIQVEKRHAETEERNGDIVRNGTHEEESEFLAVAKTLSSWKNSFGMPEGQSLPPCDADGNGHLPGTDVKMEAMSPGAPKHEEGHSVSNSLLFHVRRVFSMV